MVVPPHGVWLSGTSSSSFLSDPSSDVERPFDSNALLHYTSLETADVLRG